MSAGFNFGTPNTSNTTGGFGGFGASTGTTGAFGATPAKTTGAVSSFGHTPAPAGGGFSLGQTATPATGLSLGQTATTSTGGFNFGQTSTTTTASTGFGLGGSLLGGATPAGSTGFGAKPQTGFGGLGTATTTTVSTGFGLGGTLTAKTTAGLTLGGSTAPTLSLGGTTTTTASTGFNFGGLGGSGVQASTVSKGLGGTDLTTTSTSSAASGTNGKSSDAKNVKESVMPNEITNTVEEFKKMVKGQKNVREDIARMSSKPLFKSQEELKSLRQMLSLVTNALQRNATAINKLKIESAQELKHAEIAQRTKDTPPGLQYENTAPNDYFASLVEGFESRMMLYRQQIEEMESHLASASAPATLTPQELSMLLSRLQGSFISLAAQLQIVHEAVKAQKEHYLNYRKVFHGDTVDIFEKRKKIQSKTRDQGRTVINNTVGPTPFTGMSNMAAVAMASALNKTQQPAPGTALGGTGTGFGGTGVGLGTGTGLGLSGGTGLGTGSTGFGTSSTGFGSTSTTQASGSFGGAGSLNLGSLLGSTTTTTNSPFQSSFSFGSTSANTATVRPLGTTPMFGGQDSSSLFTPSTAFSSPGQPGAFQLQKPPNKRGKKA